MEQFYFLAIVFITAGSLVLLAGDYGNKFPVMLRLRDLIFRNQTNTIVMLVLTAVTGVLKLISPMAPGPVVLGDFIPAISLVAISIFYGFEMKSVAAEQPEEGSERSEDEDAFVDAEIIDKAEGFYYKNKRVLGYVTAGIAFFHFLFPGAVLL
ncbi:MAG: hypothetical protein ACQEQU_04495 [Spirochaetota bacterium]